MNPSKCHFLYQKNETTSAIFPSFFLTIFGHFEMLFLTGSCLGDTRPWLLTPPSALDDMHFCSGKALGAFQVVHFFATSTFNDEHEGIFFSKNGLFILNLEKMTVKSKYKDSWIFYEFINHLQYRKFKNDTILIRSVK